MGSNLQSFNRLNPMQRAARRRRNSPLPALGALLALGTGASAHDVWSNGQPVPAWVKKACCGPEDVHHLAPSQVHLTQEGWRVDGYPDLIPIGKELPSADGDYWIFYRTLSNGQASMVYCFFAPLNGT